VLPLLPLLLLPLLSLFFGLPILAPRGDLAETIFAAAAAAAACLLDAVAPSVNQSRAEALRGNAPLVWQ